MGLLSIELPQRWSVAKAENKLGGAATVELVNKDARTRAFVESRPDQPSLNPVEALHAWAKVALPLRVAAYELEVLSQSRTHGFDTVRARFDADVRGADPEQHALIVTLVRTGRNVVAVGAIVPRGRELGREKDIEALFLAMQVRQEAPAAPPDPEAIAPETAEVIDKVLGVRVVAPKSLRVRRTGRGPFARVLRLRSKRGSITLLARVVRAPGKFDATSFASRFEAGLRRRYKSATPLGDTKAPPQEESLTTTRAWDAITRGKRGKPGQPVRVILVVVHAPELKRAYSVVLSAHPNHFLVREELMTGLISSFRLWSPKRASPNADR